MQTIKINSVWDDAERCKNCAIREIVLFSDLQLSDFERIHHPIDDLLYASDAVIYEQSEILSYVYTIRSGLVKLVQHLSDGSDRIVRILGKGDLLGIESLNQQLTTHQAIAMGDVQLCRIPHAVINALHHDTPRLHGALISKWQETIAKADLWITQLSTGKVKIRVVRLMLLLAESSDEGYFFMPSREDIGSMLGITTESASKVTADLKRKGILNNLKNHQVSVDIKQLKLLLTQ